MNKKLIGAILGSFAMAAPFVARADDAAPAPAPAADKDAKPAKPAKKAKAKKTDTTKPAADAKGGEKSCGADGKSCGGKK